MPISADNALETARDAAKSLPPGADPSSYDDEARSLLLAVEAGYLTAGEDGEIDENEYDVLAGSLAEILGCDEEQVNDMFDSFDDLYEKEGYDARLRAIATGASGDMRDVALAMSVSAALATGIEKASDSKTYSDLAAAYGITADAAQFFTEFANRAMAEAKATT